MTEPSENPPSTNVSRPTSRERTCIGCGEHAAPDELVRLVLGPSGEIAVDAAGGGFGRGAHVHARPGCLERAATRGLLRVTKGKACAVSVIVRDRGELSSTEPLPLSAHALALAIEQAMARRISGLITASVRARHARVGSDSVTAAWRAGEAELVVVATDAAAARDLPAIREAVASGAAIAWGTKSLLSTALLRGQEGEGVALVAITDAKIAGALRTAAEKAMGACGVGMETAGAKRAVKVTAPKDSFRSKVDPRRVGRAAGRHLRRAESSSLSRAHVSRQ